MPYFKTENSNAENIKYDNTKSVKEAIDEIKASSSSDPTASSVTFNNTDTGLNATNVQDAITEVNGKLNMRYNDSTDKIQILFNNIWTDWISAGLQNLNLLKNGVFAIGYNFIGTVYTRTGWTSATGQAPTITGIGGVQRISASSSNNTISGSAYISPFIDLTNYKKISITIESVNITAGANTSYGILLQKSIVQGFTPEKVFTGTPISTTSNPSTVTMDVSSLTGNYAIVFNYYANINKPLTVNISDIIIS